MATRPKQLKVSINTVPHKRGESDPHGFEQNSPGAKLDAGKNRVWLCLGNFPRALDEVAKVTSAGARKYTENGWKNVPDGINRYMDAFGRHMLAVGKGEVFDTIRDAEGNIIDDPVLHKAQMIWNLMAALELELTYCGAPKF
jgi:Domain of unknown function (DUF5664)